ncbi:hypothetical protein [Nitrososphaera sp.]|uniref:DUF7128 family protein n=1 Tax=Nitrososphaera sp. TaxID=1971748 RepID=UPI00307D422E
MGQRPETVPDAEVLFYCEQCSLVFLDPRDASAHEAISSHAMHRLAPFAASE